MNILGFFEQYKYGPWRLEVAPAIYAIGTTSDIMTKADKTPIAKDINSWHFGYGGQVQATYAIAKNMNLGIYAGFTQLTGRSIDAMPKLHVTNYIVDAGIKFTISLTKKRRAVTKPAAAFVPETPMAAVAQQSDIVVTSVDSVAVAEQKTEQPELDVKPQTTDVTESAPEVVSSIEDTESVKQAQTESQNYTFPKIYFSFNSIWIEPGERAKVKEIADKMKADKSIRIRVTGWCDPIGSEEANNRVSLQRAEAVKRVLGQWLVPADRIETVGGGINRQAVSHDEARFAAIIDIL